MGRYTGPKNRLSRREGKDLLGRGKDSVIKRLNQPPGQHGQIRTRASSYASQLREKQKVKRLYGLRERQFKSLFLKASEIKEVPTSLALLQLLELRLDNVVYKLGLARTRPQARQFIVQGRILVDGNKVISPSYALKAGQSVTLEKNAFESPFIQSILKDATTLPDWLKVESGKGHILRKPNREEIDQDINENLIVAFYTR